MSPDTRPARRTLRHFPPNRSMGGGFSIPDVWDGVHHTCAAWVPARVVGRRRGRSGGWSRGPDGRGGSVGGRPDRGVRRPVPRGRPPQRPEHARRRRGRVPADPGGHAWRRRATTTPCATPWSPRRAHLPPRSDRCGRRRSSSRCAPSPRAHGAGSPRWCRRSPSSWPGASVGRDGPGRSAGGRGGGAVARRGGPVAVPPRRAVGPPVRPRRGAGHAQGLVGLGRAGLRRRDLHPGALRCLPAGRARPRARQAVGVGRDDGRGRRARGRALAPGVGDPRAGRPGGRVRQGSEPQQRALVAEPCRSAGGVGPRGRGHPPRRRGCCGGWPARPVAARS